MKNCLLLLLLFIECNANEVAVSYKIYCWDFYYCDNRNPPMSLTFVDPAFSANDLIKENYLLMTNDNPPESRVLQQLIFDKQKGKSNAKNLDARFLILLNYGPGRTDTIVYQSQHELRVNDQSFYYDFNILDSITKLLQKKCIKCVENLSLMH
jgi:hypothetical protein